MDDFYTQTIMKDPRFNSKEKVSDIDLLEPGTRARVQAIINDAKARGVTLVIEETYRSSELQELYFQEDKTKLRQVGVHHYGLACDLAIVVDGKLTWKQQDYQILGELAKQHGLIWGGSWTSFVDADHVQRCSLQKQTTLFNGSWYPDENYDPYTD